MIKWEKSMNERMNEWMNEGKDGSCQLGNHKDRKCMREWISEGMNKKISEWTNEWMNEWTGGWMNEHCKWMLANRYWEWWLKPIVVRSGKKMIDLRVLLYPSFFRKSSVLAMD